MSIPKLTGNLFRAGRALAGLTRDDLASRAGLSQSWADETAGSGLEMALDGSLVRRGPERAR